MYTRRLFAEAQPLTTTLTPPRPAGKKVAPPPPPPRRSPRRDRRTYAQRQAEVRAAANPPPDADQAGQAGAAPAEEPEEAEERRRIETLTQQTEQNPLPITNRRVWELIDILFGEVDPATMQQRITWEEIKRMLEHIGYEVAYKGQGSICTITPQADLQARGFTTALTYHRPHDGYFVGFRARQWANNRVHGLVTKGWTFECFENRVGA